MTILLYVTRCLRERKRQRDRQGGRQTHTHRQRPKSKTLWGVPQGIVVISMDKNCLVTGSLSDIVGVGGGAVYYLCCLGQRPSNWRPFGDQLGQVPPAQPKHASPTPKPADPVVRQSSISIASTDILPQTQMSYSDNNLNVIHKFVR